MVARKIPNAALMSSLWLPVCHCLQKEGVAHFTIHHENWERCAIL